eukprot:4397765-Pleurochrysis_carterae.AAC.4
MRGGGVQERVEILVLSFSRLLADIGGLAQWRDFRSAHPDDSTTRRFAHGNSTTCAGCESLRRRCMLDEKGGSAHS